jgi:hypothetical protein
LWETDFHFYTVYYLLRKKCFTKEEAYEIAYYSQFVDDDPDTNPNHLGLTKQFSKLAQYHFAGSGPNVATAKDESNARSAVEKAFTAWKDGATGDAKATGTALHLYADSWSHEGFTAWDNKKINDRGNPLIPVYIGHANASTHPDHPWESPFKATAAAEKIFNLIPQRRPQQPDPKLSDKLLNMFRYNGRSLEERMSNWRKLIKKDLGDDVEYKKKR